MSDCHSCGGPLSPEDAFCQACGTPAVAPQPQAPAYPAPQPQPQPQPPSPTVAPQPQTPAYPAPVPQGPPPVRRGLSGGVIAGIVLAALLAIGALGVGGFFVWKALRPEPPETTAYEVPVATAPPEPETSDAIGTDDAPAESAPGADDAPAAGADDDAMPAGSDDGIVTDEQARWVVTAFEDARAAKDTERARSYCSKTFLAGEWKDALKDPTWRPDSYEIVNSAPDLMYVHVVVSERWPSGDEYWIYSVLVDPSTGKPVIDGTLDPEYVPELLPK